MSSNKAAWLMGFSRPEAKEPKYFTTAVFVAKSESGERRVDFVELLHLAKIYRKPVRFFEI
jgi:hypothetical protein